MKEPACHLTNHPEVWPVIPRGNLFWTFQAEEENTFIRMLDFGALHDAFPNVFKTYKIYF